MIHSPAAVAPLIAALGILCETPEGYLEVKTRGDLFVIGSGYNGGGPVSPSGAPTAGTAWIYATPLMELRLTEPELLGWSGPGRNMRRDPGTGRPINTVQARTERYAGLSFGCCGSFGVLVSLGDPYDGGT